VDVLWYSDDIAYNSGLLVSPRLLQQYFFPWLRMIGDLARASGKRAQNSERILTLF